jgi:hypothetical protein
LAKLPALWGRKVQFGGMLVLPVGDHKPTKKRNSVSGGRFKAGYYPRRLPLLTDDY